MTMTCEHVDLALSAYFEGDLGAAERLSVDAHLRECLRCAALVRDIEGIRAGAAGLPELAPSRDLWDGIAPRIQTPVIDLASHTPRAPARRTWQLAAAAVVLMAVSSGITYTVMSRQQEVAPAVVVGADTVGAPDPVGSTPRVVTPSRPSGGSRGSPMLVRAEPLTPEVMYGQEIGRLRAIVDRRRPELDSATVAAVEKSLRDIDAAIADAQGALALDASSQFLNEQLNRALEKKLGVLRRVALLPMGAS
jgi:hypothetical protein